MERKPERKEDPGQESPRIQRFQFGPWVFNVNGARAIIAESPREITQLPVAPWAQFYGLDNPDGVSFSLFTRHPGFDRDYAMTTDLNEPVLVATLRSSEAEEFPLLIDGTHRLYRAYVERIEALPAYLLSADESLAIREDAYYR